MCREMCRGALGLWGRVMWCVSMVGFLFGVEMLKLEGVRFGDVG
jgi:hypothetical protein